MNAVGWLSVLTLALLALAVLLGLARLWRGPTAPDRVVAADTLGVITIGALVLLADRFDSALYLDLALVYGALALLGVVTLARILEEGR